MRRSGIISAKFENLMLEKLIISDLFKQIEYDFNHLKIRFTSFLWIKIASIFG
jgi:hypothetical protein